MNQVIILTEAKLTEITDKTVQNVINAKNAGLSVEIVYGPCRARSVEDDIDRIIGAIGGECY